MTYTKQRLQKLAGLLAEDSEQEVEEKENTLKEGFRNLGMAQPGLFENPFSRYSPEEEEHVEDTDMTSPPSMSQPMEPRNFEDFASMAEHKLESAIRKLEDPNANSNVDVHDNVVSELEEVLESLRNLAPAV